MALSYTIPNQYGDDELVRVPHLTDTEIRALSYAFFDKPFDVRLYEDMTQFPNKYPNVLAGWEDVTSGYLREDIAALHQAMRSLVRFGLVTLYYVYRAKDREVTGQREDGRHWLLRAGPRYKLNDEGKRVQAEHRARTYKCCEGCVHLPCVCSERTFCAEHGGGCHGTHE